jgi:hypothetical protein
MVSRNGGQMLPADVSKALQVSILQTMNTYHTVYTEN